jgi:hypothetical protein
MQKCRSELTPAIVSFSSFLPTTESVRIGRVQGHDRMSFGMGCLHKDTHLILRRLSLSLNRGKEWGVEGDIGGGYWGYWRS